MKLYKVEGFLSYGWYAAVYVLASTESEAIRLVSESPSVKQLTKDIPEWRISEIGLKSASVVSISLVRM